MSLLLWLTSSSSCPFTGSVESGPEPGVRRHASAAQRSRHAGGEGQSALAVRHGVGQATSRCQGRHRQPGDTRPVRRLALGRGNSLVLTNNDDFNCEHNSTEKHCKRSVFLKHWPLGFVYKMLCPCKIAVIAPYRPQPVTEGLRNIYFTLRNIQGRVV